MKDPTLGKAGDIVSFVLDGEWRVKHGVDAGFDDGVEDADDSFGIIKLGLSDNQIRCGYLPKVRSFHGPHWHAHIAWFR